MDGMHVVCEKCYKTERFLFQNETSGAGISLWMSPECRFRSKKQVFDAKITIWHRICLNVHVPGDGAGRKTERVWLNE